MKAILPLLLLLSQALSAETQVGLTQMVTTSGEAVIVGEDLPAAREEALVDAQRNALEQTLGVKIRAQSAVQDYRMVDDVVLSLISGYVKKTRLVSERREGDQLILEVECVVARELSEEEALKYLRNFSLLLGFSTEIDGKTVEDDRLANGFSAELVRANFDLRDLLQLASLKGFDRYTEAAIKSEDRDAARWVGRQMLANVVLVGKVRLKQSKKKEITGFAGTVGAIAYEGWVEARAYETESGQIVAQSATPVEGFKGVGDTPQTAVTEVLKRAETFLQNDLLPQLVAYSGKKSRPITIEIEGLPDFTEFQQVKQLLNNIRFRDTEVVDLGFEAGKTSTFRFNYSENINLVAFKLDRIPGLEVTERTSNRIVCRYSHLE